MRWTIHDSDPPFVRLIIYEEIPDIYMALVACTRPPPINFHPHGTLVVLKNILFIQISLVMHKHDMLYVVRHIIARTN